MKLIKLFLVVLIFFGGVYVGHKFLPQAEATQTAALAMPELNLTGVVPLADFSVEAGLKKLKELGLEPAAQQQLENIFLFQDYRAKKYIYAAEIAKNDLRSAPAASFKTAADAYNAAKKNLEKLFNEQYPAPSTVIEAQ